MDSCAPLLYPRRMGIPANAILSEDGKYVIGVNERKDRYGNVMPEADWLYKRPIPVANMQNLNGGKSEKAIEARRDSYEDRYAAFLRGLERGCMRSESANKARIAWSTVRTRIKDDPGFAQAVKDAESVADEKVLNVIWEDIIVNKNIQAAIKWQEKRNPEWADKKLVETKNTQRLEIDASDRVGGIMEMLARLSERKALAEGPATTIIDVEPLD